jgi:hypothetical protein
MEFAIERVHVAVKICSCIREVLSLNLGRYTGLPEVFSASTSPDISRDSISISLQPLPSRSFPVRSSPLRVRVRVRVILRRAIYRQSARLGAKPIETHVRQLFSTEPLCNILFDNRMGLSFTTAVGPRQRSHSAVGVPRDS